MFVVPVSNDPTVGLDVLAAARSEPFEFEAGLRPVDSALLATADPLDFADAVVPAEELETLSDVVVAAIGADEGLEPERSICSTTFSSAFKVFLEVILATRA